MEHSNRINIVDRSVSKSFVCDGSARLSHIEPRNIRKSMVVRQSEGKFIPFTHSPIINQLQIKFKMILSQRVKTINFGGDDKMLIKKPSKSSKLLESLKSDTVPASPKTPQKSKLIQPLVATKPTSAASNRKVVSTNVRKSLNSTLATKKTTSASQSRKTINGNLVQPKNTIKSMFQKQMEKSQSMHDSISEQMAAIDLAKVPASPKPSEKVLMPGSLHKRVTRRNSMTMSQASDDDSDTVPTPTNKPSCRKTVFTPRVSDVMEEDKSASPAQASVANKTVNQTVMMDIEKTNTSNKCNGRKLTPNNSIIVEAPTVDTNQKRWLLNSLSKRKTFYTPKAVDETTMLEGRLTPQINRTCLKFTMNDTPGTQDLVKKSIRVADSMNTTPYGKCRSSLGKYFFHRFFFLLLFFQYF